MTKLEQLSQAIGAEDNHAARYRKDLTKPISCFIAIRAAGASRSRIVWCFLTGLTLAVLSNAAPAAGRLTLNFNLDWKFIKADPAGASAPAFDDSAWTTISTPHTFNDTDTFDNWSSPGHAGEQNQWSGRTWYRKSFVLPETYKGKKIFIEFEAVRQVAEVYLNGQLLGTCKTGFTPFGFDLTSHLRFGGATNVLVVMVDNRFMKDPGGWLTREEETNRTKRIKGQAVVPNAVSPASASLQEIAAKLDESMPLDVDQIAADQIPWNNPHWHPAHGGIYRNVKLHVTDPLHISLPLFSFLKTAGPYVYATDISTQSVQLAVEVPIQNERITAETVELHVEVLDHERKSVLALRQSGLIAAGASATVKLSGKIVDPQLWEPAHPYLYCVVSSLRIGGAIVDTCEIPYGIRTVRWDVKSGFYINGRHLKLHGWGQKPTNEWPGLGAAYPDWMHYYTMQLMRDAGGNFVRWGHCAGGPAQIAASDALGIVADQPGVDGEADTVGAAWNLRVIAFRDTIVYFRNSPSILIWEGGNWKITRAHAHELRGYMDLFDPRGGRVYAHRRADQITAEFMDIDIGTEGGHDIKTLPVVEGEYNREESPRRVWDIFSPPTFGYSEGKDQTYGENTSELFAIRQVEHYVKKLGAPSHSGGANWIFSDSTRGGRVAVEVARTSGEVDGVRLPKESLYVCRSMFRDDPQVHVIGHWTYPAGTKKTVYVASNGEDVELFLNGKSLGHGIVSNRYLFTFPDIVWAPGEIKAVASRGGQVIATTTKHTIGSPVALRLTSIVGPGGLRADGSDVALIDVEAIDANGERCPTFQQRVDFAIKGPGIWRGGYNSGKINSINNLFLDLECGINRVAVRATRTSGIITIHAQCEGLKSGSLTIEAKPFEAPGGFATYLPQSSAVTSAQAAISHAAAGARRIAP
jgi:beta-galactosidase